MLFFQMRNKIITVFSLRLCSFKFDCFVLNGTHILSVKLWLGSGVGSDSGVTQPMHGIGWVDGLSSSIPPLGEEGTENGIYLIQYS